MVRGEVKFEQFFSISMIKLRGTSKYQKDKIRFRVYKYSALITINGVAYQKGVTERSTVQTYDT